MKRIFTMHVLLCLCLTAAKIHAQGFQLNLRAAPQLSFIRNENDDNNPALDKRTTFNMHVGIGAQYDFTKNVGIALNVLYSWQGQQYRTTGREREIKLDYVKVPLQFVYNLKINQLIAFVGKAGPQLSIRTRSRLVEGDNDRVVDELEGRYENITFGAVVQPGIVWSLSHNLFLETGLWFDHDFTNAEDRDHRSYPRNRSKAYNMTTGLLVQLNLRLRKH